MGIRLVGFDVAAYESMILAPHVTVTALGVAAFWPNGLSILEGLMPHMRVMLLPLGPNISLPA